MKHLLQVLALLFSLQFAAFAQEKAPTKWALLIGIDTYQNEAMSPLRFATSDTKAMRNALLGQGYNDDNMFAMTSDATGADYPSSLNVLKRLSALGERIKEGDTFLFYFSGHGFQGEYGHFLATGDADPTDGETLERSTLPLKILQNKMQKIKAKTAIFIIDACRDNPERGSKAGPNSMSEDFAKDLRLVAKSSGGGVSGSAILLSCDEGQRSWEWDEKDHGVFTYYIVEGLNGAARDANGQITMNDLGEYVQNKVTTWSLKSLKKQTPQLETKGAAKIIVAQGKANPILDSLRPNIPFVPPVAPPTVVQNVPAEIAHIWPDDEILQAKVKRLVNMMTIAEDVEWTNKANQLEPYNFETWRARAQWPDIVVTQRARRGQSKEQSRQSVIEYTVPVQQMLGSSSQPLPPNGFHYAVQFGSRGNAPVIRVRVNNGGGWTQSAPVSTLKINVSDKNMADNIAKEWKESIYITIGTEDAKTNPLPDDAQTPAAPISKPELAPMNQLMVRGELTRLFQKAGRFRARLDDKFIAVENNFVGVAGGFLRLRLGVASGPSLDRLGQMRYLDIKVPPRAMDKNSIKVSPVADYAVVQMSARDGENPVVVEENRKQSKTNSLEIPLANIQDAQRVAELLRELLAFY